MHIQCSTQSQPTCRPAASGAGSRAVLPPWCMQGCTDTCITSRHLNEQQDCYLSPPSVQVGEKGIIDTRKGKYLQYTAFFAITMHSTTLLLHLSFARELHPWHIRETSVHALYQHAHTMHVMLTSSCTIEQAGYARDTTNWANIQLGP